MNQEWMIQSRAEKCAATGEPFREGEYFYTLLFHTKEGLRREDLSESAWQARNENVQPFSFWRAKFEPPASPAPEALGKQTAEDLLRRYMQETTGQNTNARYILALMLERKRILKPVRTERQKELTMLIYEHARTGEVFVITDPGLKLDQMTAVQDEVAILLAPA